MKPRPWASNGFNADRGNWAMPIWMVLAKSSSRTGALSRMPYRLTPIKAFMQHSSVCTRSSSKRNNSTCSIGCLASARCIACNVGICGSLSSRFTSRLPRLGTWLWKPIVTVILRNKNQQHEKSLLWLVFDFYLDLIWILFAWTKDLKGLEPRG